MWSPGHRVFALASFNKEYFSFGATSVSLFWEARHATFTGSSRMSYVFAGDANNDLVSGNDLIYVPKDASEMNFQAFTVAGRTFTAADQAAAFEAYIQQDAYLKSHRGQYADRNGVALPMLRRADVSVTQDIFHNVKGQRNAFQIRLDIFNFFNMLNSDWGVSKRPIAAFNNNNQLQILTNPSADSQGRLTYRLATFNNELITKSFQTSASVADAYQFMLSLRYSFN
jgi:hypothetical protein